MTSYFVGDIPAEQLVVVPAVGGDDVDLTPFTTATVGLFDPNGASVTAAFTAVVDVEDETVTITWPTTAVLTAPGLYALTLGLTGTTTAHVTADATPVVVQSSDGWHDLGSARVALGNDFPADDVQAYTLLQIAKVGVTAFAPVLADGVRPPISYKQAQLMQARNILNISKTDPAQSTDGQVFVIRPYPLDSAIRQLLRPRSPGRFG
jgi:hypothetical protein